MRFCLGCGTRLILKLKSKGSLYCPKCGYESSLSLEDFWNGKIRMRSTMLFHYSEVASL